MLQRSETTAVFQLESRGMKDLIKRLQPDCFEDMIALVALFRPGPLQSGMVDNFIDRKHGREEISYPDVQWQHECLKPVLEPTYGIILYRGTGHADSPGALWLYPRRRGYAASCDG